MALNTPSETPRMDQLKEGFDTALNALRGKGLNEDAAIIEKFNARLNRFHDLAKAGGANNIPVIRTPSDYLDAVLNTARGELKTLPSRLIVAGKRGKDGGFIVSPDEWDQWIEHANEWETVKSNPENHLDYSKWELISEPLSTEGLTILLRSLGAIPNIMKFEDKLEERPPGVQYDNVYNFDLDTDIEGVKIKMAKDVSGSSRGERIELEFSPDFLRKLMEEK